MGKERLIFDTRDLGELSDEMLKGIDKAVVAAAFKIRDEMRGEFKKGSTLYKYGTKDYANLSEGIMVGKLKNSTIKVHSLGSPENYDSYKTRFFVGGTTYRKTSSGNKGYIKSNDAVDKGLRNAEDVLNTFIKNVLDN